MPRNAAIMIERELIESPPFSELNGTAHLVLMLFLCRRRMKQVTRRGEWHIINNGKILFPYAEAREKFDIQPARFSRAIDKLVECGFIDICHAGGGVTGDPTRYAISERWRKHGTEKFVSRFRQKDSRFGFTSKNWETRTGRKRKNPSIHGIKNDIGSSIESDRGSEVLAFQVIPEKQVWMDVEAFILKGKEVLAVFSAAEANHYQ